MVVNNEKRLIAGQRRLAACRQLGWDEVPVTCVNSLQEVGQILTADRDENTCRLDFKPSEAVALGEALWADEQARAKARKAQAPGQPRGKKAAVSCGKLPQEKTRDAVGKVVGMSGKTYEMAKAVAKSKQKDLIRKMGKTEIFVRRGGYMNGSGPEAPRGVGAGGGLGGLESVLSVVGPGRRRRGGSNCKYAA